MTSPSELAELRRTVRSFLEQHAPVRSQLADDGSTWKRLTTELGLCALPVSEQHGGAGASFVEVCAVLEETGRSLLRAPYLSTVVVAAALNHESLDDGDLLASLADGSAPAALCLDGLVTADADGLLSGSCAQVVDAIQAALLLVSTPAGLYVVDASDATLTGLESLDPTRPQGTVVLHSAPARQVGDATAASRALDLLHVAMAAESIGAAERCLEMAVAHLLVREQFGRPLGSFQALRHRVADLTVELEAARSAAWYAARAAAGLTDDLAVVAPLAKAVCADAFAHIAGESIQLHGGIGFTWEHDAHLYLKRAWTTALMHGDSRTLRRRAAARAGVLTGPAVVHASEGVPDGSSRA